MKRVALVLLCIMLIINLASCGEVPANNGNRWGVSLEAQNVTPTGLTLVCHQLGGEFSELNTGSYYVIQRLTDNGFEDVECLFQEYDVVWTAEAWIIHPDATTTWNVGWEWLYGELPAGRYRIGKEIMNFKAPGEYEKEMVWAEFEIKTSLEEQTEQWNEQKITAMFSGVKESDWEIVDCVVVSDNAYGFVGAVLFLDKEEESCNVAFVDKEGHFQRSGTYATLYDEAEFTYLGNGAVTYKLRADDGTAYNYRLTISVGGDSVHFVAEDDLFKLNKIIPLKKVGECTQSMLDEAFIGISREDLLSAWGNPDGNLSGFWGEIWALDDENDKQITIYYDADGKVEYVKVVDLTE